MHLVLKVVGILYLVVGIWYLIVGAKTAVAKYLLEGAKLPTPAQRGRCVPVGRNWSMLDPAGPPQWVCHAMKTRYKSSLVNTKAKIGLGK